MAEQDVPGIPDVAGLARWLGEHGVPVAAGLPAVELIAGGRSNLTYRLEFPAASGGAPPESAGAGETAPADTASGETASGDAGPRRLVLRRPPLGHVLPTAHDMAREFRVLTALTGTAVPVPRPVALCADPDVIGAPFYVMEHVDGTVLRTRRDAAQLTPGQAGEISSLAADMLAAIHGLDTGRAGLADFGRPAGYLARQLARWQRQWELSATREMPGYDRLVERLAAGLPEDGAAAPGGQAAGTLVHGDFRVDNMLIALQPQPRIAAVVDWEMSTLGDPLADLGLTLVYWAEPGEEDMLSFVSDRSVTTAPGFLTRAEFVARYAAATGRDVSRIGYYMAFGCFKLAVVLEGIHARFLQRKTVGEGFEREGQAVASLIARAHEMLDSAG
jgi:aminoglycoside phosphotransferase (APT) family kinase protein